jgi:hypothetical protein
LNYARSGGKGCFRVLIKAQARSGADFGGKSQFPAPISTKPLAIFNPLPFSHGLLEFCTRKQSGYGMCLP